jgi:DNA topoisomerase-3
MLADSGMRHLAPHALTALNNNYVKPTKRIFDNAKVSRPLCHHPHAAGAQA